MRTESNSILSHPSISWGAKCLAMALVELREEPVKHAELAEWLGPNATTRSVRRWVSELRLAGLIEVKKSPAGNVYVTKLGRTQKSGVPDTSVRTPPTNRPPVATVSKKLRPPVATQPAISGRSLARANTNSFKNIKVNNSINTNNPINNSLRLKASDPLADSLVDIKAIAKRHGEGLVSRGYLVPADTLTYRKAVILVGRVLQGLSDEDVERWWTAMWQDKFLAENSWPMALVATKAHSLLRQSRPKYDNALAGRGFEEFFNTGGR